MADFEIIEADFQQFYNLDVSKLGFQRYARLLINLPVESRFMQKMSPFKDWNWDREVQSQILHAIDGLTVLYANTHRKKGTRPLTIPEQPQPEYVVKAKKESKNNKRDNNSETQKNLAEIFEKRNKNINKMELK